MCKMVCGKYRVFHILKMGCSLSLFWFLWWVSICLKCSSINIWCSLVLCSTRGMSSNMRGICIVKASIITLSGGFQPLLGNILDSGLIPHGREWSQKMHNTYQGQRCVSNKEQQLLSNPDSSWWAEPAAVCPILPGPVVAGTWHSPSLQSHLWSQSAVDHRLLMN